MGLPSPKRKQGEPSSLGMPTTPILLITEDTLNRHCAEVILSFAVTGATRRVLTGPLSSLVTKWVTMPLPLMDVIGQTITGDYIWDCCPVFSSSEFGHFTLVNKSILVVGRRRIECGTCEVPQVPSTACRHAGSKHEWSITCKSCNHRLK